jgi:hypothetical protein
MMLKSKALLKLQSNEHYLDMEGYFCYSFKVVGHLVKFLIKYFKIFVQFAVI